MELETQAHIPSRTITKLLLDLDAGTERLEVRTVLVIDEAAMVATRQLAPIFDAAHDGGARLVLVGDPRQLQAINAGGVLRGLAERLPPIELSENRRQRHGGERDALALASRREVRRFLAAYQHHGRITVGDTADQAKAILIAHWTTQVGFGLDVIILALRRNDVTDLNHRARTELLERGRLGPDALVAAEREFRVGERVVCLANRRALGLLNGLRGEITHLDPAERSVTVRLAAGSDRVVPARYLDAGHLDHGYAMTIHKAQGLTSTPRSSTPPATSTTRPPTPPSAEPATTPASTLPPGTSPSTPTSSSPTATCNAPTQPPRSSTDGSPEPEPTNWPSTTASNDEHSRILGLPPHPTPSGSWKAYVVVPPRSISAVSERDVLLRTAQDRQRGERLAALTAVTGAKIANARWPASTASCSSRLIRSKVWRTPPHVLVRRTKPQAPV